MISELIKKDFYTTRELAEVLGVSRISVFYRLGNGSIRGYKMGRNFVIFKKDIDIKKVKSMLRK
ncbi:MAG: excisionase family DNA-binding protein [Candidatus Staskawiczbacteria bacterium]|nr:excisionase family DNA-binding protein [Candidatus Staskawiczbacteria bacterium]